MEGLAVEDFVLVEGFREVVVEFFESFYAFSYGFYAAFESFE